MPQEQQFQGGNFTPITGLVEHTAKPLETFQKVGDALQERYWKAKQQYDVLDTTIKNMPMFDKEVDQQHIDRANKIISDKISPIIENDDFHKAQGTVMDLTKAINEDKGLKSISQAIALWTKDTEEFEKRFDKEPNLRSAEARRTAAAKIAYRKQGGALDANGNTQQLPIWNPTTNLDISEDIKRIQELAVKLRESANENTTIGTNLMNGDPTNMFAGDPDMQAAMAILTKTKTTTKQLTEARIQELAKQTVEADPQYQTKLKEISQVTLFNTEAKLEADQESIYRLISSDTKEAARKLALSVSPTYKAEVLALQHNYNIVAAKGNEKDANAAKKIYENAMSKLDNSEALIKEGSAIVSNYKPEEINSMYLNMKVGQLNSSVIHSGDEFAFTKINRDIDQMTTHVFDAYMKRKEEEGKLPLLSTLDIGTESLNNALTLVDPLGQADKDFRLVEDMYNAAKSNKENGGRVPASLELQYKGALANRNAIINSMGDAYNEADENTKHNINTNWWNIFKSFGAGDDITLEYSSGKSRITAEHARNNPSANNSLLQVMSNPKVASKTKIENMTNYTLQGIPKSELLKGNTKDLIRKYGLQTTMSTSDYMQVVKNIDAARFEFGRRVAEKTANSNTWMTPQTELMMQGEETAENLNLRYAGMKQLLSGNFVDIKGVAWDAAKLTAEGVEFSPMKGKEITNADLNDNSEFQVSLVNHHGAQLNSDPMIKIVATKYKYDDDGKRTPNGYITTYGFLKGNSGIANAAILKNMNNLKTTLMTSKDKATTQLAINHSKESANLLGGTMTDETGANIYATVNSWQRGNWKEGAIKSMTVGGLKCTIKKVASGYRVVAIPQLNPQDIAKGYTVTEKDVDRYNIANIGDFVTMIGYKKSLELGLDSQTLNILENQTIQNFE